MFAAYSMFYFAAASFSEMARRSASPRTPRGFLCGDSDAFSGALERLSPAPSAPSTLSATNATLRRRLPIGTLPVSAIRRRGTGTTSISRTRFESAGKLGLTRKQVRERLGPSPASL